MRLPLSEGRFALIDECDAHLGEYNWKCDQYGYVIRRPHFSGRKYIAFLHNVIMGKPIDGRQIDHINGDRLDNRRANLRIVTRRENNQNLRGHREGTFSSRYLGVRKNTYHGKTKDFVYWVARICTNQKSKFLGSFKTEKEAAEAYQKAFREVV